MGFPLEALEVPVGPTPKAISPLLIEVLRELSVATEEMQEKDPPVARIVEVMALAHWACNSLKRLEDECSDRAASVAAWPHRPQLPIIFNQSLLRTNVALQDLLIRGHSARTDEIMDNQALQQNLPARTPPSVGGEGA